jgi:hypothetical protein
MQDNHIVLRHICFTGPGKSPALQAFERGLNVLYGASDTGKSFMVEAIDFMLGGGSPLRDIPERNGYDRILLGFETTGGEEFTLVRATQGGNFQLFEGLHLELPTDGQAKILSAKHSSENQDNVSAFFLEKINLKGKLIKKNAKGVTRNLSFRDLCHLTLIDETTIQKKESPIEATGQSVNKTAEYSVFKLLLTGVDDSALVSAVEATTIDRPQASKIELIDELMLNYSGKLPDPAPSEIDLKTQLEKLEKTISEGQGNLNSIEITYRELLSRRSSVRKKIEEGTNRRSEIDELKARFALLNGHYQSDLERLEGIREAGSLLAALNPKKCPLCCALPDHQHPGQENEGNIEIVVAAALSESEKITRLQRELTDTIRQLNSEAGNYDTLVPFLLQTQREIDVELNSLSDSLVAQRVNYSDLIEKRSELRALLLLINQIKELSDRKEELTTALLGVGNTTSESSSPDTVMEMSSMILDEFSRLIESILQSWNFPDFSRVLFEESTKDLIISGKRRGSRGKGLRAITHAAFIVGILEFCRSKEIPHPGFIVLDSPLLAYREPENLEDDLSGTNVQDKFYEYLSTWTDKQIIVFENVTPPAEIIALPNVTFFSKNPNQGRYGFFPINATD